MYNFFSKLSLFFLVTLCCSCLAGCVALPGQEPFGETTYSDERAKEIYEQVAQRLFDTNSEDLEGYTIQYSTGMEYDIDFYYTDKYTVAYAYSGAKTFLWYEGWLYCLEKDGITYNELDWESLGTKEAKQQAWEHLQKLLLREDVKLTYKHIPMGEIYRLTAEYPEQDSAWVGEPTMSVVFLEDGTIDGLSFRWQKKGEGESPYNDTFFSISFFPYEDSYSLQAERKIWSFGYDCGLSEVDIPALSTQQENREWCEEILKGMDYDSLSKRAAYKEDLSFPVELKLEL